MVPTKTFDDLLEDLRGASERINQLKENIRLSRLSKPEADHRELEAALEYWGSCKQDIEHQLRQFR